MGERGIMHVAESGYVIIWTEMGLVSTSPGKVECRGVEVTHCCKAVSRVFLSDGSVNVGEAGEGLARR